jgi:hypothetical protein
MYLLKQYTINIYLGILIITAQWPLQYLDAQINLEFKIKPFHGNEVSLELIL